jgi:DnaJ like chaperone protein
MIPIVLYGVVNIKSRDGWSMAFEASSVAAAFQFVDQIIASVPTSGKQRSESRKRHQDNQQQYRSQQRKSYAQTATTPRSKSAYEILGVNEDATLAEITAAYRKQVTMNHPDKVAHMAREIQEVAEQRMKEINAAYQELSDRLR